MYLPPAKAKMPYFPPPCMTLRSRREVSTRDQVNALHVEQWQTDGPWLQFDRPDMSGNKSWMDMNPINSRTDARNYLQNRPFEAEDRGQLNQNPYFEKFDVPTDPLNVGRELQAVVFEEKTDRGVLESKRLLNRTYTMRWVSQNTVEKNGYDTLNTYELMRPQFNKMDVDYQKDKVKAKRATV